MWAGKRRKRAWGRSADARFLIHQANRQQLPAIIPHIPAWPAGLFAIEIVHNSACAKPPHFPLTTISTSRPPHREHTSRSRQSLMPALLAPHDQPDACDLPMRAERSISPEAARHRCSSAPCRPRGGIWPTRVAGMSRTMRIGC